MSEPNSFRPEAAYLGNFVPGDGSIDFFARIHALVDENSRVLDLGAGRASWFDTEECETRRKMRSLKGKVAEIVGADIDDAVLKNKSVDKSVVFKSGEPLPFEEASFDVIIADFVLEHVENPEVFATEIMRLLKPGGYFCARTPHKFNYVSIAANVIKNANHSKFLKSIQPQRDEVDIFPTFYRLNTGRAITQYFPDAINYTFLFPANPAYFFGKKWLYSALRKLHRVLPTIFFGNLFIFVRKPPNTVAQRES